MDILDIDEVLNEDSFCLFDDKKQNDVAHILQQWKEGMRNKNTIPKPDTRTFTRVKHKMHNNKFNVDIDRKENTFDIDDTTMNSINDQTFDHHQQHDQQNYLSPHYQKPDVTFINDTSPPHSSCFTTMDTSLNNFNTNLITSNDFHNIALLNSNYNENLISSSTTEESTKIRNDDDDDTNYRNDDRIFENLLLSNSKDLNLSQIDDHLSHTTFINNDDDTFVKDHLNLDDKEATTCSSSFSTASSSNNDHQQQQQENLINNDQTFEFQQQQPQHRQPQQHENNEFLLNSLTSSSTSSSSMLFDQTFTRNKKHSNFSDRTFKKNSNGSNCSDFDESIIKNMKNFNLNETYNKMKCVDDNTKFNNIENLMMNNSFDLNEMNLSFDKNEDLLNSSIRNDPSIITNELSLSLSSSSSPPLMATSSNVLQFHSTPFRRSVTPSRTTAITIPKKLSNEQQQEQQQQQPIRSLTEKLNILKKDLDYDKNEEFHDKDDIDDIIGDDISPDRLLSDFKEIEKEIEYLEYEKKSNNDDDNDDGVNEHHNHHKIDLNVDIDDDEFDDYNKDYCLNTLKMRQSLDNIKKRYFSEKNEINKTNLIMNHCDNSNMQLLNNKLDGNNGIGDQRLLSRRSRLYDNIDIMNIKQQQQQQNDSNILDKKSDESINSKHENQCSTENEIPKSTTITKENNDVNYVPNEDQFKTMVIRRRNQNNQHHHHHHHDNDKNLENRNSSERLNNDDNGDDDSNNKTFTASSNKKESLENSSNKLIKNNKIQKESSPPSSSSSNNSNNEIPRKSLQLQQQRTLLARPRYVSQYFRQNPSNPSETFQKANSAGELNKEIPSNLNNPKQNHYHYGNKIDSSTMIKSKAKSLHNLAAGIHSNNSSSNSSINSSTNNYRTTTLSSNIPDNRLFKKPEPPPPLSSTTTTNHQSRLGQLTRISTTIPKSTNNQTSNLRVPSSSSTTTTTTAAVGAPVTSRTTRLMRPSSGYYGYNTRVIQNPIETESGILQQQQQQISTNPSINTKTIGMIDKKNPSNFSIDSNSVESIHKNDGAINNLQSQQQQQQQSPPPPQQQQPTIISKIPSKIKRSGLPRPSNAIRR